MILWQHAGFRLKVFTVNNWKISQEISFFHVFHIGVAMMVSPQFWHRLKYFNINIAMKFCTGIHGSQMIYPNILMGSMVVQWLALSPHSKRGCVYS